MDDQQSKNPNSRLATLSGSEHLSAAKALVELAKRHDGRDPISDQALIDAAQNKRLLTLFFDGTSDGSASASDPVAVAIQGFGELDLVVAPAARGRGVGTAALRTLLASGEEVRAWSHGSNESVGNIADGDTGTSAADALLSAAGFVPVRSLLLMELPTASLPAPQDPATIASPSGYRLRRFNATRDAAAWVHVNAMAFADHPEQGRITEDDFAAMRKEPWFDADDLILLEHTNDTDGTSQLAGSAWIKTVKEAATAATDTELYAIGVAPAHAGRGLGRVLLNATLARMAQHAPTSVSLYVDGENHRAVEMYRATGFTIASRSRQWLRSALPAAGATMDV